MLVQVSAYTTLFMLPKLSFITAVVLWSTQETKINITIFKFLIFNTKKPQKIDN